MNEHELAELISDSLFESPQDAVLGCDSYIDPVKLVLQTADGDTFEVIVKKVVT